MRRVAGAAASSQLIRRSDSDGAVVEFGVMVPANSWTYWASNDVSEALSVCMNRFPFPNPPPGRNEAPTRGGGRIRKHRLLARGSPTPLNREGPTSSFISPYFRATAQKPPLNSRPGQQ
jgi:hypothetical protein